MTSATPAALTTLTIVAAAAILAAVPTTPDFSGVWIVDRDKTIAAMPGPHLTPAPAPAVPPDWIVTQSATALSIQRPLADGSHQTLTYTFAGESINHSGPMELRTRSRWDGDALVTDGKTTITVNDGIITGTIRERRWLAADGSMHVESTRVTSGSPPATTITVLVRKARS